ncbi:unnamed protein product, partial [Darwinula stevensoni]
MREANNRSGYLEEKGKKMRKEIGLDDGKGRRSAENRAEHEAEETVGVASITFKFFERFSGHTVIRGNLPFPAVTICPNTRLLKKERRNNKSQFFRMLQNALQNLPFPKDA